MFVRFLNSDFSENAGIFVCGHLILLGWDKMYFKKFAKSALMVILTFNFHKVKK